MNGPDSNSVISRIEIQEANSEDLEQICVLIQPFVRSRQLLERSPDEILELVNNGFKAVEIFEQEEQKQIVGFAGVEIYSRKLAEILCLAVSETCQGRGVGKQLVRKCIEFARARNVHELMAVSSSDHFLKVCGFDYTLPDQKRALFINPLELERTEGREDQGPQSSDRDT